jgi:1-acyl-sn-glycerol-3-phosphate acyltransferase
MISGASEKRGRRMMPNHKLSWGTLIDTDAMPDLNLAEKRLVRSLVFFWGDRITVDGSENLKKVDDPVIFALNHPGAFHTLLIPVYLIYLRQGRKLSFVIDWMFGEIPLLKWIFKQIDPIYVYNKPTTLPWLHSIRQHARRFTILDQCRSRLNQGRSIGIFPEGTRNSDPKHLLKAKKGLGHLVLLSGVPVIPVGIAPLRQKAKRSTDGSLVLRIGAPLNFAPELETFASVNRNRQPISSLRKKFQNMLADRITFRVMAEIARLSDKDYPYPQTDIPHDSLGLYPDLTSEIP